MICIKHLEELFLQQTLTSASLAMLPNIIISVINYISSLPQIWFLFHTFTIAFGFQIQLFSFVLLSRCLILIYICILYVM